MRRTISCTVEEFGNKTLIHFNEGELEGKNPESHRYYLKFSYETLFLAMERIMVREQVAHNVTCITRERMCGNAFDYRVEYNALGEVCDHCNKLVPKVTIDSEGYHFCPSCWSLYHCDKPKKENNPMKTKIEILKQISVVDPVTREVLEQAIAALKNPLGVLQGDEIEIQHPSNHSWILTTYNSYDADYSWNTAYGRFAVARIPVTTEDVTFHGVDVELLEEQRLDLLDVAGHCEESGLEGRLLDSLRGIQEMLDAWSDERSQS
jgi:hypothetical protein